MSQLLLFTNSLLGLFERSQSSTHSTSLLDTEIQRSETLLLVEKTKLFTLSLVDNSQDTGNVLTSLTTKNNLRINIYQLFILYYTYTSWVLPPATFWTRMLASCCFCSSRILTSSALFLLRSSKALTIAYNIQFKVNINFNYNNNSQLHPH